jgi:hypothetical protein
MTTYASKDALDQVARERTAQGDAPVGRGVVIAPAQTQVGAAEQAARGAYEAELKARADVITDPAIAREMRARANRVGSSLPIMEFYGRLDETKQAEGDLGDVSGLESIQLNAGLRQSAQDLRDSMVYPPVLQEVVERYRDNRNVNPGDWLTPPGDGSQSSETDRLSVAAANALLGLDVAKSAPGVPASVRERIDRAVAKAMDSQSARLNLMRRDLDDFKASRGIR